MKTTNGDKEMKTTNEDKEMKITNEDKTMVAEDIKEDKKKFNKIIKKYKKQKEKLEKIKTKLSDERNAPTERKEEIDAIRALKLGYKEETRRVNIILEENKIAKGKRLLEIEKCYLDLIEEIYKTKIKAVRLFNKIRNSKKEYITWTELECTITSLEKVTS